MWILALEDVESPGCWQSEGVYFALPKTHISHQAGKRQSSFKVDMYIYIYTYISPEKMYDIVGLEHQVVLNKKIQPFGGVFWFGVIVV